MTTNTLMQEFVACAASAGPATDARLVDGYGVPSGWLWSGAARYGMTRATTEGRHWRPDPAGRPLLVLPDRPLADPTDGSFGTVEITDLIAFDPRQPGQWWSRAGTAVVLAPDEVEHAQHFGEALKVHATPLDWLRAAGAGIVVVDWSVHLPMYLSGPPSLIASDMALAERLDKALNRPGPKHRIAVPNPRRVAA